MNASLQKKIKSGKCIDVSACQRTLEGWYILKEFVDEADYADGKADRWIWSIGRRSKGTGIYLASLDDSFYQNPHYECVWLR